jgi:hypothetical protein
MCPFISFDGLTAAAAVLFGLLCCFWGFRMFRIILGILGFVIGAMLVGQFVYSLTDGGMVLTVIAAIFGGIIGSALVVFVYFIGIFLAGAAAAYLLVNMLASPIGFMQNTAVVVIVAIIGGIIALIFQKIIIIVSTAFIGAWCFVSGLFFFFGSGIHPLEVTELSWILNNYYYPQFLVMLIFFLLLGTAGCIFQFRLSARESE